MASRCGKYAGIPTISWSPKIRTRACESLEMRLRKQHRNQEKLGSRGLCIPDGILAGIDMPSHVDESTLIESAVGQPYRDPVSYSHALPPLK